MDRIKAASLRMHRLLKDILRYSRLSTQAESYQNVDLNLVVNEVWDDLQAKAEETGASLKIESGLPILQAHPIQLRQLFLNLISNAIKFRHPARPPVLEISSRELPGFGWEINVKDNGLGFDAKYSELIFKPFHRLHREEEVEGSGIGLAICKKIVDRHGGEIYAQSKKGEGSVFSLRLPYRQSSAEKVRSAA